MKNLWHKVWLQLTILFILSLALFSFIQSLNSNIMDVDGYYHIRLARMMHENWVMDRLPQAKLTLFKERFADTEFLFHVFLMPFAQHDLNAGAKLAVIVLDTLLVMTLFGLLRSLGVSWAILILLGLGALSQRFWYQLLPPRAHLLSMTLVFSSIWAMEKERKHPLAILSMLEALSYTAWHFIPGLAFLFLIQERLRTGIWKGSLLLYSLAGALLGLLIHPHPMTHAYIWYLQNVLFFLHRFFPTVEISRGSEWAPVSLLRMAQLFYVEFFLMALALAVGAYLRKSWRVWGTFAVVFFFMTKSSMKFCHYWSPVCLVWAMLALADLFREKRKIALALSLPLLLGCLFLSFRNLQTLKNLTRFGPGYRAEEIQAVRQHVPTGAYLYTCNWLSAPELFFHRPDLRLPILLDPIFAYYGDRQGFQLWQKICSADAPKPISRSLVQAEAQFIILSQASRFLIESFSGDKGMTLLWQNQRYALFQVRGNPRD